MSFLIEPINTACLGFESELGPGDCNDCQDICGCDLGNMPD